jgi:hypothetical protein
MIIFSVSAHAAVIANPVLLKIILIISPEKQPVKQVFPYICDYIEDCTGYARILSAQSANIIPNPIQPVKTTCDSHERLL